MGPEAREEEGSRRGVSESLRPWLLAGDCSRECEAEGRGEASEPEPDGLFGLRLSGGRLEDELW